MTSPYVLMTFGWFWLPPDHSLDDTTRTAFMPPHRLTNPNGLLLRVECSAAPSVKSGRKTPEIHFMFHVTSISVLKSHPPYSLSSLLQSTVIACNRDGLTVINLYLWHFLCALIYFAHNPKNGLVVVVQLHAKPIIRKCALASQRRPSADDGDENYFLGILLLQDLEHCFHGEASLCYLHRERHR